MKGPYVRTSVPEGGIFRALKCLTLHHLQGTPFPQVKCIVQRSRVQRYETVTTLTSNCITQCSTECNNLSTLKYMRQAPKSSFDECKFKLTISIVMVLHHFAFLCLPLFWSRTNECHCNINNRFWINRLSPALLRTYRWHFTNVDYQNCGQSSDKLAITTMPSVMLYHLLAKCQTGLAVVLIGTYRL